MKETLEELIKLINETLPNTEMENVSLNSDLKADLSISSFDMILLAIAIEDRFHLQIEEDFQPKTVADVCEYIIRKPGVF
ncbi:MAG: hypothetical protein E7241_10030 [Lachnospiraceae bacterium]|nr:hypothetical protein [Lachnospiraceae bacterium]